jgi:chemotaxis protein methyltransferase WspC
LLIYLERPAQEAALAALRRVVCKHGLIFVGHAETTALVEKNFEAVRTPHAFAYRNAPPVRPTPLAERRAASKVSVRAGPLAGGQPTATSASPPPPHAPAATPELPRAAVRTDEREALLALAESLADQGRLAEAENLCGKLAQEDPMEPHALFLLGIIARAKGDLPAAEACLRKVLYLDAAHPDALLHLAFLLERQGQFDAAERLRDRGRRARHDGKATP